MTWFSGATLPRRPSVVPDCRKYVCPECGEVYRSPSGNEPFACPACKLKPDVQAKEREHKLALRRAREARRKAGRS